MNDSSSVDLPDMRDYESVQRFFIKEVQLGEELLAAGKHYLRLEILYLINRIELKAILRTESNI